jgi:hypothetical protein
MSPAIALLLALVPLIRLDLQAGESGSLAVVGLRLKLANLVAAGLALVIGALLTWYWLAESVS